MKRLMLILMILFFVIQMNLASAFGKEGFSPIEDSDIGQAFFAFPEGNDCGAIRVNSKKQIYVTALHCIRSAHGPDKFVQIGNPLNNESLNYYDNFVGEKFKIGTLRLKILDHGNCWTGFGLDVVAGVNNSEQQSSVECLKGDWVIFELLSGNGVNGCLEIDLNFRAGEQIIAAGGPRVTVKRNSGMLHLNGGVYSSGQLFTLQQMLADPRYPKSVLPLWKNLKDTFLDLNSDFIFSDADIINGMSGGPILMGEKIIGVSTVGFLPNYIFEYPELIPLSEGYNFGIHGGVSIKQIISPRNEDYFSCF